MEYSCHLPSSNKQQKQNVAKPAILRHCLSVCPLSDIEIWSNLVNQKNLRRFVSEHMGPSKLVVGPFGKPRKEHLAPIPRPQISWHSPTQRPEIRWFGDPKIQIDTPKMKIDTPQTHPKFILTHPKNCANSSPNHRPLRAVPPWVGAACPSLTLTSSRPRSLAAAIFCMRTRDLPGGYLTSTRSSRFERLE